MNDVLLPGPAPDDEGPFPLPTAAEGRSASAEALVVGQDAAVRLVDAVLRRYRASAADPCPACLAGPVGVGKKTTLRAVAASHDLPVASVDLLQGADLPRLVVRAVRSCLGDAGLGTPVVVLFENLVLSSPETVAALARLLSTPGCVEFGVAGRREKVDLRRVQFVYTVDGILVEAESGPFLVSPCPLPVALRRATSVVVPFRRLSRTDLFAILAVGDASPLRQTLDSFEEATGIAVSLSENAMWALVDEAIAQFPEIGARGLMRVLTNFELRLYAELAQEEDKT